MTDETETPEDLEATLGDFLISQEALPDPDYILGPAVDEPDLYVGGLDKYLKFLELVVLNERLIVPEYDVHTDIPEELSEAYRLSFSRFRLPGYLEINESLFEKLQAKSILHYAYVEPVGPSPLEIVSQSREQFPGFEKKFAEDIASVRENDGLAADELVEPLLAIDYAIFYGIGMALTS